MKASPGLRGDFLFLGLGAMGGALVRGLVSCGALPPDRVWGFDVADEKMQALKAELGIQTPSSPLDGVERCAVVVLAVKPDVVPSVLKELRPRLDKSKQVISIAAGLKLAQIEQWAGDGVPVVRAMPNILVTFRKSSCALVGGRWAEESHLSVATSLFEPLGLVVQAQEKDMDAITALSGSGPAFVFMFLEALSDAGVRCGLSRNLALKLAIQTVSGVAAAAAETGSHPAVLRDLVTSPGGTTIHGIEALESGGFRASVMKALVAATARAAELSRSLAEAPTGHGKG